MFKRVLLTLWVSVFCFFGGCRAIEPQSEGEMSHVDECQDYPELCTSPNGEVDTDGVDSATDSGADADGIGGDSTGMPTLSLPFPIGEYWQITQSYNPSNSSSSTHQDYGGAYSDDRWAVDFAQGSCKDYGKPVNPIAEGDVYYVETDDGSGTGYGNTVIVRHENSFYSRYAHLSEILVNVGDNVDTSDYVGKVGNTGNVSGTSCSEYPGTHLHVAVYKDSEGILPEPLSGNSDLTVGCWYDRLGDFSCSGDPGSYEDDEESELSISYLAVNPENGTAGETEFVWTAVVNSPDLQPDATLVIHNPNDGVNYEFTMETASTENPWIFSYQKTLRDAATYTYWVKVNNGDGNAVSDAQEIQVDDAVDTSLNVNSISWTPLSGTADETEFTWSAGVTSSSKPSVDLYIINPYDATTYDFAMSVSGSGSSWTATYSKTLRDATTYAFWVVADNGVTTSVSSLGSLTVSDAVVEGSGGGEEDTSPPEDTAVSGGDTGTVTTDTGSGVVDTGPLGDTGVSYDTGSVVEDTSTSESGGDTGETVSEVDSGVSEDTSVADSGTESSDSGSASVDTGPLEDTGSVVEDTSTSGDTGSVADTGSGSSSSTSCSVTVPTDYSTIQNAIDSAGYSDVICVASGTYTENLSIKGMNLTLMSLSGAGSTIIDGDGKSNVISITDGSTATVDGFTIQDGDSWPGGGIYIYGANPTIKHCVVTGNLPYGITVTDSSSPVIENTLVVANIYRGFYVSNNSSPEIINSVIAGNVHDGVGIFSTSTVYLTNSIVYNNGDYGISYNSSTSSAISSYSDVYGNTLGSYYGGASASGTDFSSDPSFVDTVNYELSSGSTCIDAGDSSSSYNDVDGSRNDVGAYGGPFGSW